MLAATRNFLLFTGALWGFALALVATLFFDDGPLSFSPFLISALLCAGLSGAVGTLVAGKCSGRRRPEQKGRLWPRAVLSALSTGFVQAVAVGGLAAFSIWISMTITMTGFSVATPAAIFRLVTQPSIFLQGAVAGYFVLIYTLLVGVAGAPFTGFAINRIAARKAGA